MNIRLSRQTLVKGFCLSLLIFCGFRDVSAQQDMELQAAIAKIEYKVSKAAVIKFADWELKWKITAKRSYSIVGKEAVKNARCGPETFGTRCISPRFFIDVEEFASEADAQMRMDHMVAPPPGPDSKMTAPEFDLREGFRIGTKVYVVGTDVYGFVKDGSLTAFHKKLQDLVEDFKPGAWCLY